MALSMENGDFSTIPQNRPPLTDCQKIVIGYYIHDL